MVGDSVIHDLQGGLGAGLDAVLLDRHDSHPDLAPRTSPWPDPFHAKGTATCQVSPARVSVKLVGPRIPGTPTRSSTA